MTKNFVLTLALLLCATFTFAQTEAGKLMIGGNAGFDIQKQDDHDDIVSIDLNPMLGFFVIDNLAVGAALSVSSFKEGDEFTTTGLGIAPFGRYYIGPGGVKLFIHAQFGYITSKYDDGTFEVKSKGTQLTIGPGLAFFLNDHVAIEALLGYDKFGGDFDGSNIGLRIGVQAYLGGGE